MQTRGLLREYASTVSLVARTLDVLAIALAGWVGFALRFDHWALPQNYQIAILIGTLLVLVIFPMAGIYHSWRGRGILQQIQALIAAWITIAVALLIFSTLTKTGASFSRYWMAIWFGCGAFYLITFRVSLTLLLRYIRKRGWNHRHIVIVGTGKLSQYVVQRLQQAPWTGLDIVAFFSEDTLSEKVSGLSQSPVLPISSLSNYVSNNRVDEVWLTLPLSEEERVHSILHSLRHCTSTIRYVPDIFGFRLLNHAVTDIAGMPILDLNISPMVGINRAIKTIEDWILALIILTISSPLFLAIAVGVKLSSPGPIFYRQIRLGWNGREFKMLKFRSMPINAEQHTGAIWATRGEQRATPFGAFLRKTSLDELPQFINVLKGEMSIVGPRPERPVFVEQFKNEVPDYMKKHMVKAGITGWAQVNGWRGDTDLSTRIQHDLFYIENWSLWLDLKIIALTMLRGFMHQNAY